jgi:hypothetical protein
MKSPQKYLQSLLGDLQEIEILGKPVNLHDEVGIPDGEDIQDVLADHPLRVVAWKRIVTKCRTLVAESHDALEQLKAENFLHYWRALEEKEREELQQHGRDEDAPKDAFNRRIQGKARIAEGRIVSLGRWRRNFSDDYVWGMVRSDDAVIDARRHHRELKDQLEIAVAICDSLEHRARCLSHLASYHRDATK